MVISSDRDFLDNASQLTLELNVGQLHDLSFSYSRYLEARLQRIAQLESDQKSGEEMGTPTGKLLTASDRRQKRILCTGSHDKIGKIS